MTGDSEQYSASVEAVHSELLERAGGVWDTAVVADHLDLFPGQVRGRACRGRLLFLRGETGALYYPCVQFEDDGVVEGLERVLDAMHVQAPWVRLQLFMDDDVLGALTDCRVDDAVRAAGSYVPREGSKSRELESGG